MYGQLIVRHATNTAPQMMLRDLGHEDKPHLHPCLDGWCAIGAGYVAYGKSPAHANAIWLRLKLLAETGYG